MHTLLDHGHAVLLANSYSLLFSLPNTGLSLSHSGV